MRTRFQGVNLPLIAIIAEGVFSRLSFGMINLTLPLYAYHLKLSLIEIGFLISVNKIVSLALRPLMGWIADRFSLKWTFVTAIGLRSLEVILLIFAGSPAQLYAIRSVHGISKAIRGPVVKTLIAEHGGKKTIASAFAWYGTAKKVADSLGGAVAGILLTATSSNFLLVFIVAFLLSILPLYVSARYIPDEKNAPKLGVKTSAAPSLLQTKKDVEVFPDAVEILPSIIPFIVLGFLISSTATMLKSLMPILATEYAGLSEAELGIIYTVSAFAILFAGPLFGWLSDNFSRKLVLMVRSLANTSSSSILIALPHFPGIFLGLLLDRMGGVAFQPAWGALMADVSNSYKKSRSQIMGYMSMGVDAGKLFGPILAGFLWSIGGISFVLGMRILLGLVTELYTVVLTSLLENQQKKRWAPWTETVTRQPKAYWPVKSQHP